MNQTTRPTAEDPDFWKPRRCFREPIPEIFHAAELLNQAVDAHLAGDTGDAARLIAEANIQEVWDWTESIWGKYKHDIHRRRPVDGMPLKLRESKLDRRRKATKKQVRELIAHDGRHCLFCRIPLIRSEVRKAVRKLYPNQLEWGRKNREQHAAFQCMWMQFDHVIPHSRGGRTSLDNLIVTCSACNYGRSDSMLEEVGLIDPRRRLETESNWEREATWDGLERFINS